MYRCVCSNQYRQETSVPARCVFGWDGATVWAEPTLSSPVQESWPFQAVPSGETHQRWEGHIWYAHVRTKTRKNTRHAHQGPVLGAHDRPKNGKLGSDGLYNPCQYIIIYIQRHKILILYTHELLFIQSNIIW